MTIFFVFGTWLLGTIPFNILFMEIMVHFDLYWLNCSIISCYSMHLQLIYTNLETVFYTTVSIYTVLFWWYCCFCTRMKKLVSPKYIRLKNEQCKPICCCSCCCACIIKFNTIFCFFFCIFTIFWWFSPVFNK